MDEMGIEGKAYDRLFNLSRTFVLDMLLSETCNIGNGVDGLPQGSSMEKRRKYLLGCKILSKIERWAQVGL